MNNSNVIPFIYEDLPVRIIMRKGEPWFVGKDICMVLGISDHTQALERLDEDERGRYDIPTPKGQQEAIIVSEPGLYRLIFTSNKPAAKAFKRWVVHEVLPSISKTGQYRTYAAGVEDQRPKSRMREAAERFLALPVAEANKKMRLIEEHRKTHGVREAQKLWEEMDLPVSAYHQAKTTQTAKSCLCTLLDFQPDEHSIQTVMDLIRAVTEEGDTEVQEALKQGGIFIAPHEDAVVIANASPWAKAAYARTPYSGDTWKARLRKLKGATCVKNSKYGLNNRAISIPLETILEADDVLDYTAQDEFTEDRSAA